MLRQMGLHGALSHAGGELAESSQSRQGFLSRLIGVPSAVAD